MSIPNICIGICAIHDKFKICKGCYRSRLEIAKWLNATDEQKLVIIASTQTKQKIYGDLSG